MGQHVISFVKILGTVFIPYLGWEMNTFFIGQLKDNNMQAAWSSTQSTMVLAYCIGGGCGTTARTAVSNLIGKQLNNKAKEYALKSIIANFILAVIFGLVLIFCRNGIASIFSDIPEFQDDLVKMLFINGFCVMTDMLESTLTSFLRILGYTNTLNVISIIDNIVIYDGLTCIFLFA